MTNGNQPADILEWDEKSGKLPGMLNVLTILTFIGCGIGFCGSVWGYWRAQKTYDDMAETMSKIENAPALVKSMLGPDPMELARRTLDNRLPILILGLVGYGLCLYGAIQMRKLRKTGFPIYAIGEILPIVGMAIFIGLGLYGIWTLTWTIIVPVTFLILYATQRRHLS